jgi:DnaK suppressor protein
MASRKCGKKKCAPKKAMKKTMKKAASASKKTVVKKKTAAKKAVAKKSAAKKTVSKKTAAKKKATKKKVSSKKSTAKKAVSKKKVKAKAAPSRKTVARKKVSSKLKASTKKPTKKRPSRRLTPRERAFQEIRQVLLEQKEAILSEAETAMTALPEQTVFPDLGDQASAETDRNFMLRLRGREQRLLNKIEEAIDRIDKGVFGICDSCGDDITVKRLMARPVATLCIDCKEEQEEEEKLQG